MTLAVRVSRLPSSGCWWKSRRQVDDLRHEFLRQPVDLRGQRIGRLCPSQLSGTQQEPQRPRRWHLRMPAIL